MSNIINGTKYEIYVKNFIKNNYINTWLWNEIPIEILHKLNIIPKDKTFCDDTVATLLQAHPPGWAFECLGPNVQLELEPTKGGLIIQSERYRM